MTGDDPFDLQRFLTAQTPVFGTVLEELAAGRKRTHWMWFVFPQLRGLGHSARAEFYGLSSLEEARAYLAHPVLGPRLQRCTQTVLGVEGRSLDAIFGSPDDVKFGSSMTVFALASRVPDNDFGRAVQRYCGGRFDARNPQPAGRGGTVRNSGELCDAAPTRLPYARYTTTAATAAR